MANAEEVNGNGARRWADHAARLAERLGVPLLLLAFFLAQDAGWIPSKGEQAVAEIRQHHGLVEAVAKRRLELEADLTRTLKGIHAEMRARRQLDKAVCLSLTRDPELRRACVVEPEP